jgi:protoporphyrinogen/coproporphyrinogen III oxidase
MLRFSFHLGLLASCGLVLSACSSAPTSETVAQSGSQDLSIAPPSKSLRIAVVGAGPSGLTAADTLSQLGYENVTVFEKNNRVGGKVYSVPNGNGTFAELGAFFATDDYTTVLGYAKKYGISYVPFGATQTIVDANGQSAAPQAWLTSHYDTLQILAAVAAYTPLTVEMETVLAEDGFAVAPALLPSSDYYLPFVEFAAKRGITPITELVRALMVGFGYGYYETTPAIYYLKLLGWMVKLNASLTQPIAQPPAYTFPTGYQSIWEAVAGGLNVQLNSTVTSIVRPSPDGAPVQITINGSNAYDFDDVIVSAPLNRVGAFMSLTRQESSLFSQVESESYDVSLFTQTGLPAPQVGYFYGSSFPAGINHAVALLGTTSGGGESWQIVDPSATSSAVEATLASDMSAYGAQLGQVVVQQNWDYFPHVNTASLQSGFYYQVEALQGANHTYYVGGTLSFETVEHSARYAHSLVKAHFLPAILP